MESIFRSVIDSNEEHFFSKLYINNRFTISIIYWHNFISIRRSCRWQSAGQKISIQQYVVQFSIDDYIYNILPTGQINGGVEMNKLKLIVIFLIGLLVFSYCSLAYVEITNPKNKDYVLWRSLVEGNSTAISESGSNAYVLIWPIEAEGPWYVQPTTTFPDGSFRSKAYFGRDPSVYPEDIGTSYKVITIITNETLKGTMVNLPLVTSSNKSKEVVVIRN